MQILLFATVIACNEILLLFNSNLTRLSQGSNDKEGMSLKSCKQKTKTKISISHMYRYEHSTPS